MTPCELTHSLIMFSQMLQFLIDNNIAIIIVHLHAILTRELLKGVSKIIYQLPDFCKLMKTKSSTCLLTP